MSATHCQSLNPFILFLSSVGVRYPLPVAKPIYFISLIGSATHFLLLEPISYTSFSNLLSVSRWRKGRWLPVAPSKKFRIPPRQPKIPEELEELKRLHNNYRMEMKALR